MDVEGARQTSGHEAGAFTAQRHHVVGRERETAPGKRQRRRRLSGSARCRNQHHAALPRQDQAGGVQELLAIVVVGELDHDRSHTAGRPFRVVGRDDHLGTSGQGIYLQARLAGECHEIGIAATREKALALFEQRPAIELFGSRRRQGWHPDPDGNENRGYCTPLQSSRGQKMLEATQQVGALGRDGQRSFPQVVTMLDRHVSRSPRVSPRGTDRIST